MENHGGGGASGGGASGGGGGGGEVDAAHLPERVVALDAQRVVCVAAGGAHSAFATAGGGLFTCGRNDDGQLGQGHTLGATAPAAVASLRGVGVAHVAAGAAHTAVASLVGQLWVCGRSSGGQLGLGASVAERALISRFTPVPALHPAHRVVQVSCGDAHTCVLTSERRLFSFGVGKHGQLGHAAAKARVCTPKAVEGLPAAMFISCGGQHTVALGADRQLYTWGSGKGCLGQGPAAMRSPVPTQICASD